MPPWVVCCSEASEVTRHPVPTQPVIPHKVQPSRSLNVQAKAVPLSIASSSDVPSSPPLPSQGKMHTLGTSAVKHMFCYFMCFSVYIAALGHSICCILLRLQGGKCFVTHLVTHDTQLLKHLRAACLPVVYARLHSHILVLASILHMYLHRCELVALLQKFSQLRAASIPFRASYLTS